ncbi:MAG: hypothetical protein JW878_07610 [Methanomicrobia archaeon]|nr:hypothetical protein [Methanomicrobia archaeon]
MVRPYQPAERRFSQGGIDSERVAAVLSSTPNRFKRIYQKAEARRGAKMAIVATDCNLAELVCWVFTNKKLTKKLRHKEPRMLPVPFKGRQNEAAVNDARPCAEKDTKR